jgi:peptide subunit release factor 1 (eRF1)
VIASIASALGRVDPSAAGAVVIADRDEVLLVESLPDRPRRELARWSSVPSLTAVLEHRQAEIPVILVFADRSGADLVVSGAGRATEDVVVEGEDSPITKSAPGGWSQRRYHQRVEDSWEHNAASVVAAVEDLAAAGAPDLVVLGGDVRATALIREGLRADLQAVTRTIGPGRARDGSQPIRSRLTERLVDTAVAAETVELVHAFKDQAGHRAVDGVAGTFAALQQSQVDVLLVHDTDDDERQAYLDVTSGLVSLERSELEAMGGTTIEAARLVDVAVRAALSTGAAVRVIPTVAAIDEGLGALLRWADAPTGDG